MAARAGVDTRDGFPIAVAAIGREGRTIYTPFHPEVLGSASAFDAVALARAMANDPRDDRSSRKDAFRQKLVVAAPASPIHDLDSTLDTLRGTKSAAEMAIIREATHITGLGIMEAMRDARPGMREYELQADAEFVFKKNGAYGAPYFALVATGTNTAYSDYHRNTAVLRVGDMVQFDYVPDFEYYVSDVTRVFPANGRFIPRQREFYDIYLALYRAVMTSIRVHATPQQIIRDAVLKMDSIMSACRFIDLKIRAAALPTPFEQAAAAELSYSTFLSTVLRTEVGDGTGCRGPLAIFRPSRRSPSSREC